MTTTTTSSTYSIDAEGRTLGRVASEAAKALMGKMRPDYTPHIFSDVKVTVENAAKLSMRDNKRKSITYANYSGYPGGHRVETFGNLSERKGANAAVRLAITRMLPRNALRAKRLKNLTINN